MELVNGTWGLKRYLISGGFVLYLFFALVLTAYAESSFPVGKQTAKETLLKSFNNPPDSVRPGVYWYFMDGNLSQEAMTADLESMKKAGIGSALFLEVDMGIPRGPVDFLSQQWQDLFKHAVRESERLGIRIMLGLGPGWTGSGGPWVKPEQSMQHLVYSVKEVAGPSERKIELAKPEPRQPFFGEGVFTKELKSQWNNFYEDVAVLAFPTPTGKEQIKDIDEKALYYRAPFSSRPGVKPFLPAPAEFKKTESGSDIDQQKIIDLTDRLLADGTLNWKVPNGKWTIMRFGRRNNGAVTRPAPIPGLGFECDKFDTLAFDAHFDQYIGKLIAEQGDSLRTSNGGLTTLHMDSWEMGSQNWTSNFRKEFRRRRGYDPLPFFPVYAGKIVGNKNVSERFLWDLRQTAQELVLEYHAGHIKKIGHRYGLNLSIEPYDMNPCADMELGSIADTPMCEFWSKEYGLNTSYSCLEATSIAHVLGKSVVAAEAFTSKSDEGFRLYPGALKNQGDWAFCSGINRFVFHTFAHKSFGDQYRPGMTMGKFGVHWDRGQTWWPMVADYHRYLSRCSYLLQQGRTVADILYLTPEGAPMVFTPPSSALTGNDTLPDRRGYNFDGCAPSVLIAKAKVLNHQIVFPGGAKYQLMVLPAFETMTPALLNKIESLVRDGAVVVGNPPLKSPSLVNYPECDQIVRAKVLKVWRGVKSPTMPVAVAYGRGKICWGGALSQYAPKEIYPSYEAIAAVLNKMGVAEDFTSTGPVRYTHRKTKDTDIYFVSNRMNQSVQSVCFFNVSEGIPELWDPLTGDTKRLPAYSQQRGGVVIPLKFDAYQSFFIVLRRSAMAKSLKRTSEEENFPNKTLVKKIDGSWNVSFDPKWGGPESVMFDQLKDWTLCQEEGIKYYSGIAIYRKTIQLPESYDREKKQDFYLDLGEVNNIARVRLNGKDLGIVWTAPWQVRMNGALKSGDNELEIEVANLWTNRLIGDEKKPDDGIKNEQWPDWLTKGEKRNSGRYTFCTYRFYNADSPLLKSGLIGPVSVFEVKSVCNQENR